MAMYDIIIRNGNIYGGGLVLLRDMDMAIKDGRVVMVDKKINASAVTEIDAGGRLVSPAFVEPHIHMDMMEYAGISEYKEKAKTLIDKYISHGVTTIRAAIFEGSKPDVDILHAMAELKNEYKGKADIRLVVPYVALPDNAWQKAAAAGIIDYVGGEISPDNYKNEVDLIFAKAKEYDLPIDVDCDKHDEANVDAFLYITEKTMQMKYQRKVTCNHVTALDSPDLDKAVAVDAIVRCARACMYVTTTTASDMYTSSWKRRGPTKVRELIDSGVGVSIGHDGCSDGVCPFGNANPLEEAQLTANIHKFATNADFAMVYEMITIQPALSCQLEDYGTAPGCKADIVVIDAPDMTEAILSKSAQLYVIKDGKLVAGNGAVI